MKNITPSKTDYQVMGVADVKARMVSVRGQAVLLDRDVAALYGVETKHVNQAVRNNPGRFLDGYVFELSNDELQNLRSKILTANQRLLATTFLRNRPRRPSSSISQSSKSRTK